MEDDSVMVLCIESSPDRGLMEHRKSGVRTAYKININEDMTKF